MRTKQKQLGSQDGIVLLEGLIAILIFSLGILAIVGMQAVAVKQATDAKYRSDASMLAEQLIGTMWASDRTPATLQSNFNTGNSGYNTWLAKVTSTLPGAADNPPTVQVSSAGETTITIYWRAPTEAVTTAAHQHITIAVIR